MWSQRVRAQLGLMAASIVLATSVSILIRGREGLKPHSENIATVQPRTSNDTIAMTSTPHFLHDTSH